MSNSNKPAPPETIAQLRRVVDDMGLQRAARAIGFDPLTCASALAQLPLQARTHRLLARRLTELLAAGAQSPQLELPGVSP